MISEKAYDEHVAQLFDVLGRITRCLTGAEIDYRVIGGVAVYLHVAECDEMAARMTRDIDIAAHRRDLARIGNVASHAGFEHRWADGMDILVDALHPKKWSAVHMIFVGEKVRPAYLEPVPQFSEAVRGRAGALLAPVTDLVRMKLTSNRLKDKVHIQDMDGVGLITPAIEAALPAELQQRLAEIRAVE